MEYKPSKEKLLLPEHFPIDEKPKVPYGTESQSISKCLRKIIMRNKRKIIIGLFVSLWIFCGILFEQSKSSIEHSLFKEILFFAFCGISFLLLLGAIVFTKNK